MIPRGFSLRKKHWRLSWETMNIFSRFQMSDRESLPPSYFDEKYRADIDPWGFRTSIYEQQKYRATIAALRKPSYASALEVGCSIGVMTSLLAARCERFTAVDSSSFALAEARRRQLPNVTYQLANMPRQFPQRPFELIMISEV